MIASCFNGWRLCSVRCDEGVRRVRRRGPKLVRGFGAVIRRWPHAQTGRYSWFVGYSSFSESSPLFLSAFFLANFAQAESEQIRSAPSMNQTAGWMPSTGDDSDAYHRKAKNYRPDLHEFAPFCVCAVICGLAPMIGLNGESFLPYRQRIW